VFFSLLIGCLASPKPELRGFLIGAVFGGGVFPLGQWIGLCLERRNVRKSIREMIVASFVFPSMLIASWLRDFPGGLQQNFLPFIALGGVLGMFVYVTEEVDWKRRWLPVTICSLLGMAIGVWMFYHVQYDFPMQLRRGMLRPDLSSTDLFFSALFGSLFHSLFAFVASGLLVIFIDRRRNRTPLASGNPSS
jgi:hypothetical protein